MTIASIQPPPQVRHIGRVNWEGLKTLYLKEVRRFAKVATQTVLAPLVTTLLFLAIFVLALGRSVDKMGGVTVHGVPGARPDHDGHGAERLRQHLLLDPDRQGAGQYRRRADAAFEPGRADRRLRPRRHDPRPGGRPHHLGRHDNRGGDAHPCAVLRAVPCGGRLAAAVAAGHARRHLGGEVRSPGGGDELRHHALRVSLRHVLFRGAACRASGRCSPISIRSST